MKRFFSTLAVAAALIAGSSALHAAGTGSDEPQFSRPSADSLYRDAVRAVKAEDYRGAIALLNKVLDDKPRHPDALNYLGFSHRQLKDYGRAVSYYKRALDLDPDHRGANEYLGKAYIELGDLAAAAERLAHLKKICGTCEEAGELETALAAARAQRAKQG